MRTSSVMTISLPPGLMKQAEKIAKQKHMTRSEFMRTALREYIETKMAETVISDYKKERKERKLKVLKGSLVDLMK